MSETTVRGRPVTVSGAHFKQTICDELRRRAERDARAAGDYDYNAGRHQEALKALAAFIESLPPNSPPLESLRDLQASAGLQTDTWEVGPEQSNLLSLVGTDGVAPPVEIVFQEVVHAGIQDLGGRNQERYADISKQLVEAQAKASRLEPLIEELQAAQEACNHYAQQVARLEGDLTIERASAQHFRDLAEANREQTPEAPFDQEQGAVEPEPEPKGKRRLAGKR